MILQDAEPCPVSGLPVYSPPHWHYRTPDEHYQGNLSLVGTNIMVWQPWGCPKPEDAEAITSLIFHALDETFSSDQAFYACFDYSSLENPPIHNRLKVMTNLSQIMNRLDTVYFFGMGSPVKQILRLSLYLGGIASKVRLARDYRETITSILEEQPPGESQGCFCLERPQTRGDLNAILSAMARILWKNEYDAEVPPLPQGHPLSDLSSAVQVMAYDLARREELLLHRIEALDRSNAQKEQRILTMTHEMRTPLLGISGSLELLGQTALTDEQQTYLDTIKHASQTLTAELGQIIESVHIEQGSFTAAPRNIDIRDFLHEIKSLFTAQCSLKGLELSMDIQAQVPRTLTLNDTALRHILINLLGNAVKFTHRGSVTIRCSIPQPSSGPPREMVIQVQDTGRGIAPHMQDRIFERYVQDDSETSRQPEGPGEPASPPDQAASSPAQPPPGQSNSHRGMGLGLSIVKVLTASMGGTISLTSTPRQGSTFSVRIPLYPPDTPATSSPMPLENTPQTPPGGLKEEHYSMKAHILIIDDDETTRFILSGLCRTLGITTQEAATSAGALSVLQEKSFDLILLDNYLDAMSGTQVLQKIRELPNHRSTPVISVSGITQEEGDDLVKSQGFTDFLQKPISRQSLEAMIAKTLSPPQ